MCDGHTDGKNDTQKDNGHFYVPPLLHRVTNRKNSYTAFNQFLFLFIFFFLFIYFFQNGKVFHGVLHVN